MQFTTARLLAFAAAVSQALARVQFTNTNWAVEEGVPFTLSWTDADGPVTLLLKNGPSTDLATVSTIASGLTGTSFTWTPSALPSDTYAVEILDSENEPNYGAQFVYAGTGVATTSATSATATAASTSTSDDPTTTTTATSTGTSSTTLTTAAPSTSGNATTTASSTDSTSTSTRTRSSSTSSATATSTPITTSNSQKVGSPLALVLLTVAAMMLCH